MSNNLQSKLGEGLSKFQGGIEQGKQKLQLVQEINRLKKEINEVSGKKAKVLLEVGQATYNKIRQGEITDPELVELTEKLVGFDHNIYQSRKKVAELNSTSDNQGGITCPSCQTVNSNDAKFCGGCGAKVEAAATVLSVEGEPCVKCEESIPHDANFCPCCGTKVVG
ncbi:zinc ribbon domain-containing protein [Litchfieldia alkalitelluris]|uniref:zinc ribbon domain-containing protein n=1 Tax=Litchfieldia alkalitelluris TaxID=304268 RepID=UPI00147387EA|nr:zinc ribbon domain-containing protein [Litchfieldia alkalitelluris]